MHTLVAKISARISGDPLYSTTLSLGAQRLNSDSQLGSTEEGATTKKGVLECRASTKWQIMAITWGRGHARWLKTGIASDRYKGTLAAVFLAC